MSQIEDQVVETWRIHNRVSLFMIENIPEKALTATLSTRGGRDIARQLAHLHNVRAWRLKAFARRTGIKLSEFDPEESPGKKKLLEAFKQSGTAMEQYRVRKRPSVRSSPSTRRPTPTLPLTFWK